MDPMFIFDGQQFDDSIAIPSDFENEDALVNWLEENFGGEDTQQVSQEGRCNTNGDTLS